MNLKALEYVAAICKCGSINKAAQNLYMSQPNLSNAIKNLEEELGYSIFVRKNSGVQLTNSGVLFLQSAKKILAEIEKIDKIPSQFTEHKNISISCTYSSTFMQEFIKFKRKNPSNDVEDNFKETGLIQTIQDVIDQRYRLSLFYCFDERTEHHRIIANQYDLEMINIATGIPAQVMLSVNNPLAGRKYINFADLPQYSLATYQNFEFDDWLGILNYNNTDRALYIFDRGGLVDTVRQSNYIAVTIKTCRDLSCRDGCMFIPIVGFKSYLHVFLLKQKSYTMNDREKQFISQLKSVEEW